jgi:hypothetical protein
MSQKSRVRSPHGARSFCKKSPRGDSNPQPPDPKSDALSIAPLRHSVVKARMAQWIRRLPTEQEIPGSSPGMGFFFQEGA